MMGDDEYTNADFLRSVSRMTLQLSQMAASLSYGAWNPQYCAADAAENALGFFADLRGEIEWAEAKAASAIEARQGGNEVPSRSDESAASVAGDAQ